MLFETSKGRRLFRPGDRSGVALGVEVERVRDDMQAVSHGDRGMDRGKTAFRLRKPVDHEQFCRNPVSMHILPTGSSAERSNS